MAEGDCAAVAVLVHELAADAGARVVPKLDAASLAANALDPGHLLNVTVAERDGAVIAACLGLMTYSTWRGASGLYVVDLVVARALRGHGVGEALLRVAMARAARRGARYVKLEVDTINPGAARFYQRLGFAPNDHDQVYTLDEAGMQRLAGGAA